MEELVQAFTIEQIGKSGARFDYEKAKWFNQKYIQMLDNESLATKIKPLAEAKGYQVTDHYLAQAAGLMKDRVVFLTDFVNMGYYMFEPVFQEYDVEALQKKWNISLAPFFSELTEKLDTFEPFTGQELEEMVKAFVQEKGLKPGDVLPVLRIALVGTMKGPAVFDTAVVLGRKETVQRLRDFLLRVELIA